MTIKNMDRVFFVYVYHKRKWEISLAGVIENTKASINIVFRKIFAGLFCAMCNNDFVHHHFFGDQCQTEKELLNLYSEIFFARFEYSVPHHALYEFENQ